MSAAQGDDQVVLLEVRLPPGDALKLVRDGDETLTIQRDGKILPGCFWRDTEMHKAISEFRLISRQLKEHQH